MQHLDSKKPVIFGLAKIELHANLSFYKFLKILYAIY